MLAVSCSTGVPLLEVPGSALSSPLSMIVDVVDAGEFVWLYESTVACSCSVGECSLRISGSWCPLVGQSTGSASGLSMD